MGKAVVADERLWSYCKQYNPSKGYVVGLILGQPSQAADHIVHLTRIPPPDSLAKDKSSDDSGKEKEVTGLSLSEIKEAWVANQALDVTRMLPGGMWVLGLFLIGLSDPFENQQNCSRLRTILRYVQSELKKNPSLYGDSPSEKLLLHINVAKNLLSCRSVDLNGSAAFKQIECKFQKNPVVWTQIESVLNLNYTKHLNKTESSKQLRNQFQAILGIIDKSVNNSICTLSEELLQPEDAIENLFKKRKGKPSKKNKASDEDTPKSITANLYMPMIVENESESHDDIVVSNAQGIMYFIGGPASRVFVHQKATAGEACSAVKQDIMRSLTARLQMHADSLVEEEPNPPEDLETVHEPPRRVMIKLPSSPVTFSDYLFPGEGPEEALVSSEELLDLTLDLDDVEVDVEVHSETAAGEQQWNSQNDGGETAVQATSEGRNNNILLAALGALLFALIAILLTYMK